MTEVLQSGIKEYGNSCKWSYPSLHPGTTEIRRALLRSGVVLTPALLHAEGRHTLVRTKCTRRPWTHKHQLSQKTRFQIHLQKYRASRPITEI